MAPIAIVALCLSLPAAAPADESDAKQLAQSILTKGAALFDTRDAAAMAATYTDDAEGSVIKKDGGTGKYKIELTRGRAEFEHAYQELFKSRTAGTT